MRSPVIALSVALAFASLAGAQEPGQWPTPEIRPFAGAYIPVGGMRDAFEPATMLGAQVALELSQNFHVVGSGSYTRGETKLPIASDRTNIWQFDIGVETNLVRPMGGRWTFRPFVGLGGGWRTYDYGADNESLRNCTAGYAALGSEFQTGPVALRIEGRDYLSCFESPITDRKTTRNDIGLTVGFAYHIR